MISISVKWRFRRVVTFILRELRPCITIKESTRFITIGIIFSGLLNIALRNWKTLFGHGLEKSPDKCAKNLTWRLSAVFWSTDHVHVFVSIPPHQAVSDVIKRIKGRTSRKIQMEFPNLRKKFWRRHFWSRGYFCTTTFTVRSSPRRCQISSSSPISFGDKLLPEFGLLRVM